MSTAESLADGPRVIKRYANRKLYDTGSGELTSMRKVEDLVRAGVEVRVVDHDTGTDMTGEILAGILASSFVERPTESDIPLLTALIRDPGELLQAMLRDEQRADELRAMGDRVRMLSTTIDALLSTMEPAEQTPSQPVGKRPAKRGPAKTPASRKKGA